jgi:hypothetical protein
MGIVSDQIKHIRRQTAAMEFGHLQALFAQYLHLPEDFGATERERLYTHGRVFWIFLAQVLGADGTCTVAVQSFLAWLKSATGKEASPHTGAYCTARKALPREHIKALHTPLVNALDGASNLFWGRRVLVVDGSSLSMPDTQANQKRWPQPQAQKPGCGFPVMRILGMFSLGTGLWRALAFSALAVAERTLFHSVWDHFTPGDIALADTGFCSYADYVLLERKGVDSVMLNHQRRHKGLREITKLGENDRLVEWFKGKLRPNWLTPEQWEDLPQTFSVREITVHLNIPGFRTKTLVIATTLRDPNAYPAAEIAALYRRRWAIELYFRDIKISMSADVLRCKTPDMVEKELWMHVIAYNLVRALMLEAAHKHGAPLERISFKGTCDAIRNWGPVIAQAGCQRRKSLISAMLQALARNLVPHRPNRTEPRAKKRRPKNYQLLTEPRHTFKESPHRGKYRPSAA